MLRWIEGTIRFFLDSCIVPANPIHKHCGKKFHVAHFIANSCTDEDIRCKYKYTRNAGDVASRLSLRPSDIEKHSGKS